MPSCCSLELRWIRGGEKGCSAVQQSKNIGSKNTIASNPVTWVMWQSHISYHSQKWKKVTEGTRRETLEGRTKWSFLDIRAPVALSLQASSPKLINYSICSGAAAVLKVNHVASTRHHEKQQSRWDLSNLVCGRNLNFYPQHNRYKMYWFCMMAYVQEATQHAKFSPFSELRVSYRLNPQKLWPLLNTAENVFPLVNLLWRLLKNFRLTSLIPAKSSGGWKSLNKYSDHC